MQCETIFMWLNIDFSLPGRLARAAPETPNPRKSFGSGDSPGRCHQARRSHPRRHFYAQEAARRRVAKRGGTARRGAGRCRARLRSSRGVAVGWSVWPGRSDTCSGGAAHLGPIWVTWAWTIERICRQILGDLALIWSVVD
jgi:hypothetical protein